MLSFYLCQLPRTVSLGPTSLASTLITAPTLAQSLFPKRRLTKSSHVVGTTRMGSFESQGAPESKRRSLLSVPVVPWPSDLANFSSVYSRWGCPTRPLTERTLLLRRGNRNPQASASVMSVETGSSSSEAPTSLSVTTSSCFLFLVFFFLLLLTPSDKRNPDLSPRDFSCPRGVS